MRFSPSLMIAAILLAAPALHAQTPSVTDRPYKLLKSVKVGGAGGWDYCFADAADRRLYIPRSDHIALFNLDTLAPAGEIPNTPSVHGVAVDPLSHHGFSSSRPVSMWDTTTLKPIKTIDVQGSPDGILFDPATQHVFVLSHRAPNVTVINAADGAIVGTLDIGGAPEQAATDGKGHVYIDVESKDNIAVIDANTLKVTAQYDLAGKGGGPAGLALDVKNHLLFAGCRNPATCVVLNADNGRILATRPIGQGVDAAEFNPATNEAFFSTGDGLLTVVKENSPTDIAVEQSLPTKHGARTSTLDAKTGNIYLITADYAASAPAASQPANRQIPARPNRRGGHGQMVPDSFTILVAGK